MNETNYKRIIIDVDGTLCYKKSSTATYDQCSPNLDVIKKLQLYRKEGFYIIIYSSRQMRSYNDNVGKINVYTIPTLIEWLKKYDVPFDELFVGKPWCGDNGFYVDDKTIRPYEFVEMSYDEIANMLHIKNNSK